MLQLVEEKKKQPFLEFAYWGNLTDLLRQLSELAMKEDWNYSKPTDRPFPILYNYLSQTANGKWSGFKYCGASTTTAYFRRV